MRWYLAKRCCLIQEGQCIMIDIFRYIPYNEFQCRPDTVQNICNVFLADHGWRRYHPLTENRYRECDAYVSVEDKAAFYSEDFGNTLHERRLIKFTNIEIDTAVNILLKAGYHLFCDMKNPAWPSYFFERDDGYAQSKHIYITNSIPHQ